MSTNAIEQALAEVELPEGVRWYEVSGQRVFPVVVGDTLSCSSYACLIRKLDGKWYGAGVKVTLADDTEAAKTRIAEALTRFVEFDADGGELPKP